MKSRVLNVYIEGIAAGALTENESGALAFRYLREYRGAPLSSSMPLSTRTYGDKIVRPYIWGLLPEDSDARRAVATENEISPNNPFALLGVMGLDCPGAVQFYSPDAAFESEESLEPISESEIARRLSLGRTSESGWLAINEHWSLGGQQKKFALRLKGDRWFSCKGPAATTHIFKSGVRGLGHQALNEYVCLRLASELAIPAVSVKYREFENAGGPEPAIIIERYDRRLNAGRVLRLHQEDFCQALSCLPDNKYTMYGGPGASEILNFLLKTGEYAQANVANFLEMLFFNYLIAGTDAHAKNYSIMLNADGSKRLAPMYDVASALPYIERIAFDKKPPKLAMSIGGENRPGAIRRDHLEKLVQQCNLGAVDVTADGCANLITAYANMIPVKIAKVFDSLEGTQSEAAAKELREHMEPRLAQLCEKSVLRLR